MTRPLSINGLILSSAVLSIGSFFFITLLLVSYLSKNKVSNIRNRLYKNMLIISLLLIVCEINEVLSIMFFYDNYWIMLITFKIYWSIGIVWFCQLYYYSIVFMDDVEGTKFSDIVKYNKVTRFMFIFFILAIVVYVFLPFDPNVIQRPYVSYIAGINSYFAYAFCAVTEGCFLIHLLRNIKRVEFRKRLAIWLMLGELIVLFIVQMAYVYISFLGIGAVIQMFFLYFNVENPDLFMIKELEKVNKDIGRSNRAKSDFLTNMSREIKAPMNDIVDYSKELINSKEFDENKVRNDIRNISLAGSNLLDVVNNILDISKIESGKDILEMKEYSLSSIVMEVVSIIKSRIENKPIELDVVVDPNLPSKYYGDSNKILQILLNILSNSVKYTEVGKIRLIITGNRKNDMEQLHIKISDTGSGMKKEDANKLLEKFRKFDSSMPEDIDGTGLGLVITKKYVDLMGGRVYFESKYRAGSIFYVDLEQKIVSDEAIGDIYQAIGEHENEVLDCTGYKVLLVDDNKLNMTVASKVLAKYNFTIEMVDSAKECIYKIKADEHYDIIFLDHMMPEMDGVEALHILRSLEGYELPPIVALTANAITGMRDLYLKEGFDEYLAKPINVVELDRIINKFFSKK